MALWSNDVAKDNFYNN